jgi:A/G-specific adenine glycosylase
MPARSAKGRRARLSESGLPAPGRALARRVLGWYDRRRRRFPWRARPGEHPDPYRVWLAEIMLQQTTTRSAEPYFEAFVKRWPTLDALAQAPLDAVLHAWQGLGYYARARNLHRTARQLVSEHGGRFPESLEGLGALPGVGAYTAAALGAIAVGRPVLALDGNTKRVLSRLCALDAPAQSAQRTLERIAAELAQPERPGDLVQALMDLGATVCTPKTPRCAECPLGAWCRARAEGLAEALPRKARRTRRERRHGVVFWLERGDGAVLLRRRPEHGLLGGLMEFPSTDWGARPPACAAVNRAAPAPVAWRELPGEVRHGFSHFELELRVLRGCLERGIAAPEGRWCRPEAFERLALPTLMRKVARHVAGRLSAAPEPSRPRGLRKAPARPNRRPRRRRQSKRPRP